jgi:metal-responsive CopG/Arc/MetJ family transcriptional regulator
MYESQKMKTGRPKNYQNKVMFTTTMEADLLERFKAISLRDGKNMNEIIQEMVIKYLKIHESGNEQYTLDDPVVAYPAFGTDYKKLENYFMNFVKDSEFDEIKFKLHEWCSLFKKRFGVSIF